MPMRGIHIANEKRRNAEVAFESQVVRRKIRTLLKNGKKKVNVRILKSTVDMDAESLSRRYGSWEEVADALIEKDPELDIEITGKKLTHIRRFVFTRSYQLRHINGATFDFLYAMAQELAERNALVMVGGGKKGTDPILLTRGGQPYRGFLEGRIKEDRYMLILHLTDIELKTPEDED